MGMNYMKYIQLSMMHSGTVTAIETFSKIVISELRDNFTRSYFFLCSDRKNYFQE